MALRKYAGFVGPSYTSESRIAAYDELYNWYPERIESGTGVAAWALYPTPGYVTNTVIPDSPGRAIFAINGALYVLYGTSLYTVSDVVTLKSQGISNIDGSVAQMLSNGDAGHQILIRADTTLYAFDVNTPVTDSTTLDAPTAAPTSGGNSGGVGLVPFGYFGYAYTWVTATGETTASPRIPLFNPGPGPLGGEELVEGIAAGPSMVTSRNVYRTEAQADSAAAMTAQLKLVGSIAGNASLQFQDLIADAGLGVDVPTVNTATIDIDALTTIAGVTSNMIAYLNSYGLSLDSTLSQVNFSEPLDFTDWPALNVFQRSDAADRWKAMLVNVKEIWLFGSETTSVYYNDPDDADEPFKPNPNVLIQIGIFSPLSACMVDGQPMWIGQGVNGAGVVYRASGYTPERVSNHSVEYSIQAIRDANVDALTLAEGSTYQEDGHVFYELMFPTLAGVPGVTWVYDTTSGLWAKRGDWDGLQFVELDIRGHAQINAAQYTVSRTSGNFYRQWIGYSTGTNGLGIKRLRRAPHINQAQYRIRYSHFRLLMEVGLGSGSVASTDPAYDPQISLRWSDDGGQTFGSSYTVSAGRIGEYSTLVEWRQLGQARDRIFELTCDSPVPWRLIDAFLDYTVGPS